MEKEEIGKAIHGLVAQESMLFLLFLKEFDSDEDKKKVNNYDERIKELGNKTFDFEYQVWYSKSIIILKEIFPERLAEFIDQYQPDSKRKELDVINYRIADAIRGLSSTFGHFSPITAALRLKTQFSIMSASEVILNSRLKEIQGALESDVFEKEIESALQLYKNHYLRSSGAICGVLLEKHLSLMVNRAGLKITKSDPTINDLNQFLYKNKVFDSTQYKFVLFLSDIRNKCDHNKSVDPTEQEVLDLINGTKKVIQTY